MGERNYNYDLMRVVACLMIICMHAPIPSENANSLFLNATGYFTAPGLCLFFVLSGALLLPVKMDIFAFLKRRLSKVVMPTLCFTLLYMGINILNGSNAEWLRSILSIPFSTQGHGVLWFMYTLVGLYLLSPILSCWLQSASRREVEFYLLLWGVTLCYPLLSIFLEVNSSTTGILYYFTGYAGYFLLGYYLKTYPDALAPRRIALPVIIAVIAPVICKLAHWNIDFYSIFWYQSVFVAILVIAYWCAMSKIHIQGSKLRHMIVTTSNLSFGIYLAHIAIMRNIIWKWEWVTGIQNYYMQWAVVVIVTFALAWGGGCYVISLLPFGDHIIGYKQKRGKK